MNYMIKDGFRVLTFLPLYFNVAKNQVIQNRKVMLKIILEECFILLLSGFLMHYKQLKVLLKI